jgi:hypothetical protein
MLVLLLLVAAVVVVLMAAAALLLEAVWEIAGGAVRAGPKLVVAVADRKGRSKGLGAGREGRSEGRKEHIAAACLCNY